MKGWKIAEISGIGIYIHWSFLVLPILVLGSNLSSGSGIAAAIQALLFVLAIFGCVVLHELGHALMARRFHIGTRSITLLPIGGVASLDRMPERPSQELAVAVAGPAVNVAIAGLLLLVLPLMGAVGSLFTPAAITGSFLMQLFWANVGLVVFNMLPAFPMDGGRVLRSLLAMFLPHVRATNIAAGVGQAMAILFAIAGIYSQQWMLVFVAMFVFVAGRAEAQMARSKASFQGWSVGDAMKRHFHMVPADITLDEAGQAVLFTPQDDFPVIEGNRLVGLLAKHQALQMLAQGQGYLRVGEVMRRDVPMLDQNAPLTETLDQMQAGNYTSLPVANGGHLVGMLTAQGLREWISNWTARGSSRRKGCNAAGTTARACDVPLCHRSPALACLIAFDPRRVLQADRQHDPVPAIEDHFDTDKQTDHEGPGKRPLLVDEQAQQQRHDPVEQHPSPTRKSLRHRYDDANHAADEQEGRDQQRQGGGRLLGSVHDDEPNNYVENADQHLQQEAAPSPRPERADHLPNSTDEHHNSKECDGNNRHKRRA